MAKNGLNVGYLCHTGPKPRRGRSLGYVAQNRILRAPIPPDVCGFQASQSPNETPRPPYQWSLGGAGGQLGPRQVGANGGSTGVPRAKKVIFFKVVSRPLGMLKRVFFGCFERVVARFGPWKIPKRLEIVPFQEKMCQKWVKKAFFQNSSCTIWGAQTSGIAHFEPEITHFGTWKRPKCLENEPLWDQKWVKAVAKTGFSKSDPRPFGMLKEVLLARFEPVVTRFGPLQIPKCLENGPV